MKKLITSHGGREGGREGCCSCGSAPRAWGWGQGLGLTIKGDRRWMGGGGSEGRGWERKDDDLLPLFLVEAEIGQRMSMAAI